MKRIIYIVTLSLFMFMASCSNDSKTTTSGTTKDSVDTAPVNEMSNPNYAPGSNTPGEGTGNGDTSSYERMPQKTDSSK